MVPIPKDQSLPSPSTAFKTSELITTGLKPLFMELDSSSNNENLLLGFDDIFFPTNLTFRIVDLRF